MNPRHCERCTNARSRLRKRSFVAEYTLPCFPGIVAGETREVHGLREEHLRGVTAVPRDPHGKLFMACRRLDRKSQLLTHPFEKPAGVEVLLWCFNICVLLM